MPTTMGLPAIRPLSELTSHDIDVAGGKGANLGELVRAGFAVPDGFVIATDAYREAAAAAGVRAADGAANAVRLRAAVVGDVLATAIRSAYASLGRGRVAVRSSATAEDLPGASFAGQQDTFLNVEGDTALLDAVRRCWASLWTERAVAYRRANGIDDSAVSLAVVVQRMVDASAAGVVFTADPLTGTRRRAAIDAIADLGEKLVSGAVVPDHYVVDTASGAIAKRQPAADRAVLSDEELRLLASTCNGIERHFGAPQDVEFAFDRARQLRIVQSRPITTLYPLPDGAPDPARDLRVYFSANVAQGVFEPFTAMGLQTFRLISASLAERIGYPVRDPIAGAAVLVVAGMRIYIDVTAVVRNTLGRRVLRSLLGFMEARSGRAIDALASDPRVALRSAPVPITAIRVLRAVERTGAPAVVLSGMRDPDGTRERILAEADAVVGKPLPAELTAEQRVDLFEHFFLEWPARLFPKLVGLVVAGMLPFALVRRVLGRAATPAELQTVLRGLPHNPTTEMDLDLWRIARDTRADASRLEPELARFLERYGHRAVGEIDIGVPRWREDPSHLHGAIEGYLELPESAEPPDAQFARGAREAEAMIATLLARVHGPRRFLARALLRRVRANAGAREQPKNQIIRIFAKGRALLAPVGDELATRGRIERADDLWHLFLPEIRRAVAGEDMRALLTIRRDERRRELARRRIPRILLSDGTDVDAAFPAPVDGALRGSPASPGSVTGVARVILSPVGAKIGPGEVLIAPSTDPGWTPLFLTAGGLVMEMGGMMSHGAVVAREYGIPAVVGVPGATERITSGQRVTVDGAAGTVTVER